MVSLLVSSIAALSAAEEISDDVPEAKEAVYNERGYARRTGTQLSLGQVDGGKQSVAISGHEQVLLLERQDD